MTRAPRSLLVASLGVAVALTECGTAAVRGGDHPAVPLAVALAARTRAAVPRTRRPMPPARPATPGRKSPAAPRIRPRTRVIVAVRPPRPPLPPAPAGPTTWPDLNRAIARIPSYYGTGARWVVESSDGHWGTADLGAAVVYIGPQVPTRRLYDVAVHEWSHLLSVAAYGGDVTAALDAMGRYFGGGDRMAGPERAADCMARLQGAQWTYYTSCADARWRAGAARLLRRQRL